ncbi:signal peptidase I [Chloroflexota bacterium]
MIVHNTANMKGFIREALITILAALVIFLGLQETIQSSIVLGSIMEPNFETGQRLIVNKVAYRFDDIKRGDVVILRPPSNSDADYIKRVIALPGETVEIKDELVYIDGGPLSEPYILDPPHYTMKQLEVPQGYCFVLGDNRNSSNDSHIWGPLPQDNIVGKVWLSIWPPSDWEVAPNYFQN